MGNGKGLTSNNMGKGKGVNQNQVLQAGELGKNSWEGKRGELNPPGSTVEFAPVWSGTAVQAVWAVAWAGNWEVNGHAQSNGKGTTGHREKVWHWNVQ